jgi:hypothetical protein
MFTITFEMEYEEDAQLVRQVVADLQFGILGRYIDNSAGDPAESPRGSITPSFIQEIEEINDMSQPEASEKENDE